MSLVVLIGQVGPARGCSVIPPNVTVTGLAVSKADRTVTYDVLRIEHEIERTLPRGRIPDTFSVEVGKPLVVAYDDGGFRFIEVGETYRVAAWFSKSRFGSGVRTAEDFCGGGGTSNADGSKIDTARTVLGVRVWPNGTGFATIAALSLATVGWRRSRRHRTVPVGN